MNRVAPQYKPLLQVSSVSYKTTSHPGAGVARGGGARVSAQSEVVLSCVYDDGLACDVHVALQSGEDVAELSDDLPVTAGLDVAEVAYVSLC